MPTLVADADCTNVDHRNDLNKLNDNITESMSKASEAIFDNNCAGTNRRNDTHSIPGWNEHVDELHNIARQSFMEWIVDQSRQLSRISRESHGFWQFLKAHGRETQSSRIFVNLTECCDRGIQLFFQILSYIYFSPMICTDIST